MRNDSENFLIMTITSKLPFRTKIRKEDETIFFYILDDSNNNCATLSLYKDEITINSLRYTEYQKKCTLNGNILLKGILKLCPSIISSVKVDDQAFKIINYKKNTYKIMLTPFRKFIYNKGWYEKFGFKPYSKQEWKEYDTSYTKLRMTEFSHLSSFLWILTSFAILNKLDELDENLVIELCSKMFESSICEDIDGYDIYKFEQKCKEKQIKLNVLINFFKHFGVQQTDINYDLIQDLNIKVTNFKKITVWDKLKPKIAVQNWRKTYDKLHNEDLFEYIIMLNEILNVLVTLNCLKTPNYLQYKC